MNTESTRVGHRPSQELQAVREQRPGSGEHLTPLVPERLFPPDCDLEEAAEFALRHFPGVD